MASRGGLGRGLSALIPAAEQQAFQYLPIGAVRPNARQPRDRFDEQALATLADSVRRVGVLQPLLVRPQGDGYELIAGERRLRAAQLAGLREVPAIIRDTSDEDSLEHAVLENIHREDLNALEEAAAYRQLLEDFGLTHDALAERVGRSRTTITNALRLLGLPGRAQELLVCGELTAGHARALLGLDDPSLQTATAERIVAEGWSVRQTEEAVRTGGAPLRARRGSAKNQGREHPALAEVGELLGDYLDTRVRVRTGKGSGKLVIEFGSLADLERISQMILGAYE